MDIQKHLSNAFGLVQREPVILIGGGFVLAVANAASLGLLSGPLFGAYLLMLVRMLRDNRKPEWNDLFSGFQRFGDLVLFVIPALGMLFGFFLLVIPGLVLMTWWIYTLFLMADQETPWLEAMKQSRAAVTHHGFVMHLVLLFMLTVVPSLLIEAAAAILPPAKILLFALMPLQCGCLASLYLEIFPAPAAQGQRPAPMDSSEAPTPPSPPSAPPPTDTPPPSIPPTPGPSGQPAAAPPPPPPPPA